MKTVKSLLLGTAAGFVAFTGANAADLPMAEPVEYVKVCSTYGDGFFYIPGTDTCLRVSGFIAFDQRADFGDTDTVVGGAETADADPDDLAGGLATDGYSSRTRVSMRADARTETEWGTLRSYWDVRFEEGFRGDGDGDGAQYIEDAFIQFAGFTAGRASSFYDFVETATYADFFSDVKVNTFAYTATFGSGFAATVAIEDRNYRANSVDSPNEVDVPNAVAALRVDQAWGSAQVSAALQDNEGDEDEAATVAEDYGYAVQAAVKLNAPFINEDSYVWVQGTYSEGATSYGFLGNGIQTLGFANGLTDFDPVTGENNELWAVGGGVSWAVAEKVELSGSAAYIEYEGDTVASGPDREIIQAAARVVWTPITGLHLGVEGQYTNVDFDGIDDTDDARVQARVQRSF